MKRIVLFGFLTIFLSGCIIRTYSVTRERLDQGLTTGNRGYLYGQPKNKEATTKKNRRTIRVLEIEFGKPVELPITEEKMALSESEKSTPATQEAKEVAVVAKEPSLTAHKPAQTFVKYTVRRNDTLQKISRKFYGTTGKWMQIYKANKNILSAPDKIYTGQILNIPLEELKDVEEGLK
jgi:nucleoid-associated protein YgaU